MPHPSTCPVCGEDLVERERWTIDMADWEQQALTATGRELRDSERARIIRFGACGAWRSMHCPAHPTAVGFLAERVPDGARGLSGSTAAAERASR